LRYLLDTHALVWWLYDVPRLPPAVARLIQDPENQILVSAVSAFEVANKFRIGKWAEMAALAISFDEIMGAAGFVTIPVASSDASQAGLLKSDHRDPFDRLIAAQAIAGKMPVLSIDTAFDDLGAERVW
jgi:PIN domain nuclease of toxin-antitoxin system